MLLNQDPGGQATGIVIGRHRHPRLQDGRPPVQFRRDEMHRRAMLSFPRRQGPLVGVEATVFWQQGGVDIEHSARVVGHEAGGQDAHEASQHDQAGVKAIDQVHQGGVVGLPIVKILVTQDLGRDARPPGPLQAIGIPPVGDHGRDADGQVAVDGAIDQGLEIAPAPRDQDHDGQGWRLTRGEGGPRGLGISRNWERVGVQVRGQGGGFTRRSRGDRAHAV